MNLFYSPAVSPSSHTFDKEESAHIVRVLRLKEGDSLHLTNGKGSLYECTISLADPKRCNVSLDSHTLFPPSPHPLHIAIAPTKNISRFEWFLEKATEIGVDAITPLICTRSERTIVKTDRLQKVLIAAMKQSSKTWLPALRDLQPFRELIRGPFNGQRFIAWCETETEALLQKVLIPDQPVLILIGPEGDFSDEEVGQAIAAGFTPVSLGSSRLRTETAGVVACVVFQQMSML
ncbi:MAG: 16S rRNA (uracil(1498)-N(3))-methyltransferase [Bacteroidetes bacterium]|nr:MAG: 16S rRNA (uracil(1498)-N(3))-methyltransferase [Bacteroidota bacterium]